MNRILIIDADRDLTESIGLELQRAGFDVLTALHGQEGVQLAIHEQPDLIVLNLSLPGRDRFAMLEELKNDPRAVGIPVILLAAPCLPDDPVQGLEAGADDYMAQPFNPRELVLRAQAVLKRAKASFGTADLVHGPFRVHASSLEVFLNGQPIKLTTIEFKLLLCLCERPGQPSDRSKLQRTVWGRSDETHSRTLDTHMKRLRRKLGDHGDWIETVRGAGYQIAGFKDQLLSA